MSPRLSFAADAIFQAGRLTLGYFGRVGYDLKSDNTPVTIADREAEALLRKLISQSFPGEAILGEEEGLSGVGDDRWVIDPIDGTKSFVAGVPLYGCLLSYERDGEPVIGAAYFPALEEILLAEKGAGCTFNGRACRVSTKSLQDSLVVSGSLKTFHTRGCLDGLMKLSEKAMALRTWCDAYGHALVATGRATAMLDPIVSRWDISAVSLIVREAGGKVTDFAGNDVLGQELISSNGVFHDELVEAMRAN
ncbi:MAG: histidinol phosphate phosphatase [Armatimonadetes bacterium]|nr:histidinol phosphate phosphatase [Armatimonadota bacterium]